MLDGAKKTTFDIMQISTKEGIIFLSLSLYQRKTHFTFLLFFCTSLKFEEFLFLFSPSFKKSFLALLKF